MMETRHEEQAGAQSAPAPGGGLLLARAKVKAARERMSVPSDNTGGKSDQNDS
ncbi:hypothetical protein ACFXAZ_21605 [Streptomyces sp. NPDC059477]|uniref:hypothetical protein n=1 Tax=Streptomyces sp. NPDC059477 TaxID=3346847 RepID=UPI0036C8DB00